MTRVKIPNTVVREGRRYWQAKPEMRAEGFASRCFGPEGPDAQRAALALFLDWQRHKRGERPAQPASAPSITKAYPRGTIGEGWQRWIRTAEWARLAEGTRHKEWWPAWTLRIEPVFGDLRPADVTLEDISRWRQAIVERKGIGVAHKALKIWRRLWRILAAFGYCQRDADPSLGVVNTAPAERHQQWREGEVVRLVKGAWRRGERVMAAIVAVCWETSFSPGDVTSLRARHVMVDTETGRIVFDRRSEGRAKTGAATIGLLGHRADRLVRGYLEGLKLDWLPDALIFPRCDGRTFTEDVTSKAFAKVRAAVFPGDARQLRDIRRSATNEAFAGGADRADVAKMAANSLDRVDRLFKTYSPVEIGPVRRAQAARRAGRRSAKDVIVALDLSKGRR